jgi:hypothetical protein
MATIRKEFTVPTPPDEVWAEIRDFAAPHRRVAKGAVLSTTFDGAVRTVTLASGNVTRERLITVDDQARRLVYSVLDRFEHHNASYQVFPEGTGSRVVWQADLLPDTAAVDFEPKMEAGAAATRANLS